MEFNELGRQVDIYLGVYAGTSTIKTKGEALIAMARLDEIVILMKRLINSHQETLS